jgi:hypothetical protein
MSIQEQLDLLADYQAQIDVINMDKQALLDAVQIPAEVLAAQDEANKRRQKAETEYHTRRKQMQDDAIAKRAAVVMPVLPPEYVAAYEAAQAERAAIQEEFDRMDAAEQKALQDRKAKIDAELTGAVKEVYAQVEQRKAEISAEFAGKTEAANANIARLTAAVKAEVIKAGQTVKGKFLQAVYVKGRTTWNNDMLEGMIAVIPQLEKARKIGEPSITIRRIG